MRKLRFFRCKHGSNFEIFQYEAPDQNPVLPKNSDIGGHHLAFYVDDFDVALEYLKQRGVRLFRSTYCENLWTKCRDRPGYTF